ncbi:bifunctional DNA primase/polymerase [Micropruina sp.]|uniref:bifunctional DNA primase/polymerase n=1 Tax=Micropruina sp. TaxID=2737536 RepID=UPI0039E43668
MPETTDFTRALLRASGASTLAAAARHLAVAGVPVFPCAPLGKHPYTPRGFHDASTDPDQVEAWWARIPGANLGVPTGAVSGMVVVDVDVHGPADGRRAFESAVEAGLVDGWSLLVRTPTGGMHAYYRARPGVEQRPWQAARAGIDFRGDGGYIIVVPSVRVIDDVPIRYEITDISDGGAAGVDSARLRDFLDPRPGPVLRPGRALVRVGDVERLASWVAGQGEGERNRSLFWAACRLAENGVAASDARDVLVAAARQPGFDEREIARTVNSAYRRVHAGAAVRDSGDSFPRSGGGRQRAPVRGLS